MEKGGEGVRGEVGNDEDAEAEVAPVVRGGVGGVLRSTSCVVLGIGGVDGTEVGGGGSPVVGSNSTLRFLAEATAFAFPLTISGTAFDQDGTRGTSELHRRQSHPVERPKPNPLPLASETGLGSELDGRAAFKYLNTLKARYASTTASKAYPTTGNTVNAADPDPDLEKKRKERKGMNKDMQRYRRIVGDR